MKLPLPQSLPPHMSVGRGKCKFNFTQTFSPFHFQLGGFNKLLHHGQCQEQQSQTGVHLKEQGPHCCMSAVPRHSWEVTDPFWRGAGSFTLSALDSCHKPVKGTRRPVFGAPQCALHSSIPHGYQGLHWSLLDALHVFSNLHAAFFSSSV